MGRLVAFEYAIAGCIGGDPYLTHCRNIGAILEGFDDCAGFIDGCPPGVSEEEWRHGRDEWVNSWCRATRQAAAMLWRYSDADFSISIPWRPDFVVRAWRVTPSEARQWDS